MAPALTEPLSSAEKLSNSTASAAPATRSFASTTSATVSSSSSALSSSSAAAAAAGSVVGLATGSVAINSIGSAITDKRLSRNQSSKVATSVASARITRSKDAYQRVFEQSVVTAVNEKSSIGDGTPLPPSPSAASSSQRPVQPKLNGANSNEQMGLSPANSNSKNNHNNNNNNNTNTNNNNNNNSSSSSNTSINQASRSEQAVGEAVAAAAAAAAEAQAEAVTTTNNNTTAQLLADLTNDFEEAITAEICSRKPLLGLKTTAAVVNKHNSNNTSNSSRTISINSISLKEAPAGGGPVALMAAQPGELSDALSTPEVPEQAQQQQQQHQQQQQQVCSTYDHDGSGKGPEGASKKQPMIVFGARTPQQQRAQIISVEELPPVSTDSTMTASEIEDNLEERLSQLDGGDTPTTSAFLPHGKSFVVTTSTKAAPQHHHHQQQQHQQQQQQLVTPAPSQPFAINNGQQQQQPGLSVNSMITSTAATTITTTAMAPQLAATPLAAPSPQSAMINSSLTQTGAGKEPNAGDELQDQDIEEVLKALKGFDGNASADALCDLNMLFNEVYTSLNCEEINNQAQTIAAKPTPLQELRMDIERTQLTIQRKIDFMLRRMRKMQARYMCKHASEEIAGIFEWCARAAAKNRGGSTTSCTNAGSGGSGTVGTGACEAATATATATKSAISVISARPPATHWDRDKQVPVSSTQMYALLRKLEASANAQQICHVPNATSYGGSSGAGGSGTALGGGHGSGSASGYNLHVRKPRKGVQQQLSGQQQQQDAATVAAAASGSTATGGVFTAANNNTMNNSSSSSGGRKGDVVVPTLDENVVEEMTQVTGLLQSEMREVQNAIDSEVTDSSSGCESADEMVIYNNPSQKTLPIAKRAAWRYTRDRAAIASRWSWLLTQIADLEIKIRQHNELHQELIRKKGMVKCDIDVAAKGCVTAASSCTTTANAAPATTMMMMSLDGQQTQSLNGYKGDMMPPLVVSDSSSKEESGTEGMGPSGACRTRGFAAAQFRKRKLLQTTNIHTISKKAARPSTIKCGCQWPLNPCTLCTGRADPTAPRDLPDTMMKRDRVALLDPGYHPVLSFPENVSSSIHFEAIARQPEWQHRVARLQPKSIVKHVLKAEREAAAAAGLHLPKKYGESLTKRRYVKKKNRMQQQQQQQQQQQLDDKDKDSTVSTATTATADEMSPGNGTGSFSTSTTPLVANKQTKMTKRTTGNGKYPPPESASASMYSTPTATGGGSSSHHHQYNNNSNSVSYLHPTSDYPHHHHQQQQQQQHSQNYDQSNHSQAHSSLTSSSSSHRNNNKYRKNSLSAAANAFYQNHSHNNYNYNNNNATNINNHHNNNNNTIITHHHNNNNNNYNSHHYQYQHSNGGAAGDANDSWENISTRSRTSSPTHAGSSNYHKYERALDRKSRISYDIDNIVIPYSVAAATRVEILPYKEIPTPKWRVVEDKSNGEAGSAEEVDAGVGVAQDKANDQQKEKDAATVDPSAPAETTPLTNGVAESGIESPPQNQTSEEKGTTVATTAEVSATTNDSKIPQEADACPSSETAAGVDAEAVQNQGPSAASVTGSEKEQQKQRNGEAVEADGSAPEMSTDIKNNNNVLKEVAERVADGKESPQRQQQQLERRELNSRQNEEGADASGSEPSSKRLKLDVAAAAAATVEDQKQHSNNNSKQKSKSERKQRDSVNPAPPTIGYKILEMSSSSGLSSTEVSNEATALSRGAEKDGKQLTEEPYVREDISDDAMMHRHERALTEERRKFQTFLKFPWSTRSRANRRIDSRAESSGANTPDPASPAPPTPGTGADQENSQSIPSPMAPLTPLNPLEGGSSNAAADGGATDEKTLPSQHSQHASSSAAGSTPLAAPTTSSAASGGLHSKQQQQQRQERRRTTSTKKEQERRSVSPTPREVIPPYEPLKFPLTDDVYTDLLQATFSIAGAHDEAKSALDDCCYPMGSGKLMRQKSHMRYESNLRRTLAKSVICDMSQRRHRQNHRPHHHHHHYHHANNNAVSQKGATALSNGNGTAFRHKTAEDSMEEEAGEEEDLVDEEDAEEEGDEEESPYENGLFELDDDDDDYPKHHLAPNDDVDDGAADYGVGGVVDDEYEAYVGGRHSMMDSDNESSDAEPFADDDPNDPEWKGGSEDRAERSKRRMEESASRRRAHYGNNGLSRKRIKNN